MGEDAAPFADGGGHDVMAAIDGHGRSRRLVIADLSGEESWLSVPAAAAARLADWR